jgi:hypothetical protein
MEKPSLYNKGLSGELVTLPDFVNRNEVRE